MAAMFQSPQGSTRGVAVSPPAVVSNDVGGSCEVEAPGSSFWSGGGGKWGGIGGRVVPLLAPGAEHEGPQDLPLALRGPKEWAI